MKKQKMKIPKSMKIYIRREKEKIRQSAASFEDQKKMTDKLYEGLGFLKTTTISK